VEFTKQTTIPQNLQNWIAFQYLDSNLLIDTMSCGQNVSWTDERTSTELTTSVEESHAPGELGLLGGSTS
jgi:hypothetical protein